MMIAHRFIGGFGDREKDKSVKRTAEAKRCEFTCCSVVRFTDSKCATGFPSAKALGYCHSVRFADEEKYFCSKAAEVGRMLGGMMANPDKFTLV